VCVCPRFIIAAAISLAVVACGDGKPATKSGEKPATVSAPKKEAELTTVTLTADAEKRLGIMTAAVEQKPITRIRTLGGEIIPPSGAAVSITAPVAGKLLQSGALPAAGTVVRQGQILFRLVPLQSSERDAVIDAQQAAETTAARREAAARRVQRAEQLVKDGSGSRRALEDAQAELAVAEAELKGARERAASAARGGTSDSGVAIAAPETGVVQAIHVREGQTVAASAPLVDLVRLASVWVRVPVYAGESASIDPAASAEVVPLGSAVDASGLMARPVPAPPAADPSTAGVDLYYALTNTGQRFRPGERVSVRLARRDTATSLVVPKATLLHDAYGGTWVYVVRAPQQYARQRVAVADISGATAILSRGPVVGARVVTDGAAELFGVEFGVGK
jgi:membrane fusion protein, heavy metal efflux system